MRFALTCLAVLALAGCSGSNDDDGLSVVTIGQPESIFEEGLRLPPGAQMVRDATSSGIVAINSEGEVVPALGESWIVTDDGRSFIFRLRQVTWSDGDPLTAEQARASPQHDGFAERAAELGAEIVETIRVEQVDSVIDGRRAYRTLLEGGRSFDAIFCANDLLGLGTLLEARQQGRRIPDDLALLTFGDNDLAGELSPRLSTISFDSNAMGTRAGEMIVDRLDPRSDGTLASSLCLDLELIPGETT